MAYMNIKTFELYHQVSLDSEHSCVVLEPDTIYPVYDFVYIDDMIAPIIQLLNKKGYETCFCCSDHSLTTSLYIEDNSELSKNGECDNTVNCDISQCPHDMYISFNKPDALGQNLPEGWKYDEDNHQVIRYYKLNSLIRFDDSDRANIDGNGYFNTYRMIIDIMESLYNYVKNLPHII